MSSPVPHSAEYRTVSEQARHGGSQTIDVAHLTDNRRPLDQSPDTTTETDEGGGRRRRRQTKAEAEEDGDRRRRRQTKTDTVEDEDRVTLGMSELAASL